MFLHKVNLWLLSVLLLSNNTQGTISSSATKLKPHLRICAAATENVLVLLTMIGSSLYFCGLKTKMTDRNVFKRFIMSCYVEQKYTMQNGYNGA